MATTPPRDPRRTLEQTYGIDPSPTPAARTKRVEPRHYRPFTQPLPTQPIPEVDRPRLRLVRDDHPAPRQPGSADSPIDQPTDPRWVLAVRTSEQLQGTILTPEARHRLTRLGRLLGLNPFDTNLVIAIVQDQARRGVAPDQCPAAAVHQLSLIPPPTPTTSFFLALRRVDVAQLLGILAAAIVIELLVLRWWF